MKKVSEADIDKFECGNCGQLLDRQKLTTQQINLLREAVTEIVIKKADIYQSTNPKELAKFLGFLETRNRPFDVIIDGPNVSFTNVPANLRSFRNQSKNLYDVVKKFYDLGWKVLVVHKPTLYQLHDYQVSVLICRSGRLSSLVGCA